MSWDYFMAHIVNNGHLHETVLAYGLIVLGVAACHWLMVLGAKWRALRALNNRKALQ